eukprot:g20510.t1
MGGVTVELEEAQNGHVAQEVEGVVKMDGDQKVLSFVMYRLQMLHETVPESTLGRTDIEEATLGAMDTIDQVGGHTDEPLLDMEGLLWDLDGGEGRGVEA